MSDMHYCDIFGDCYHCPASFCPYEKLEQSCLDDVEDNDEDGSEDENLQD